MGSTKYLDGKQFGRLTAIKYLYSEEYGTQGKTRRMYLCECSCGNHKIVSSCDLMRGNVKSCGCLNLDNYKNNSINPLRTTHGMSNTRLYQCWGKMKRRCSHEPNWIKKGIVVCEEWRTFEPFMTWAISNGYEDNLTLDRIDPLGNYEPSNCRWVTLLEQANNKTNNRKITIYGVTNTLSEWSRICGVPAPTISKRIEHGHPESSWLTPVGEQYFTDYNERKSYIHKVSINGETRSITEWSKISGLKRGTLEHRLESGWPEEELLAPIGTIYHGNRCNNLPQNKRQFFSTKSTKEELIDFYKSGEFERQVDISRFRNAFSAKNAFNAAIYREKLPVICKKKENNVVLFRKEGVV